MRSHHPVARGERGCVSAPRDVLGALTRPRSPRDAGNSRVVGRSPDRATGFDRRSPKLCRSGDLRSRIVAGSGDPATTGRRPSVADRGGVRRPRHNGAETFGRGSWRRSGDLRSRIVAGSGDPATTGGSRIVAGSGDPATTSREATPQRRGSDLRCARLGFVGETVAFAAIGSIMLRGWKDNRVFPKCEPCLFSG